MVSETSESRNRIDTEKRRRVRLFLVLVVLLGAALRLYGLADRSLWYDEGASLYLTRYVDTQFSLFNPEDNNEAPLNAILVKGWYSLVRTVTDFPVTSEASDFFIRLLPCLFGIVAIPLLFLLARRLLSDETAALLATLVFAISPFQIYYAQELRIYSCFVVLALLGTYFMVRALEENKHRYWLAMVIFLSLLVYAHFIAVWFIFTLNVYFLFLLATRRDLFWRWTGYMALVMVLIVPALLMAWWMNQVALNVEVPWHARTGPKEALITFKNFFAGYGFQPWAYRPLMLLAGALLGLGLLSLWRQWRHLLLILLLIVVPLAGNVLLWRYRHFSFYEHRLFIYCGVMCVLGVGQGLRTLRRPMLIGAASVLFVALTIPHLYDYYNHRLHPLDRHRLGVFEKVDFRSPAAYIQEHWQEGDLLAHASLFTTYSMKHYLPVPQHHLGGSEEDAEIYVRSMGCEELLRRHDTLPIPHGEATADAKRVWLLEAFGTIFDPDPQTIPINEALARNFDKAEQQIFNGTKVTLYVRPERGAAAAKLPPNVVLVVIDALRADRINAVRDEVPIMPYLAAMQERARSYRHAITPCSWTRPAMASLFTSQHVDVHQVYFSKKGEDPHHPASDVLPAGWTTLAEYLGQQGFENFAVQTNANLTAEFGFAQGYAPENYLFAPGAEANNVTDMVVWRRPVFKEPFFVYAHYMEPHVPYDPPEKYRGLFGPAPNLTESDVDLFGRFMDFYMDRVRLEVGLQDGASMPMLSEAGQETVLRNYDGECRFADDEVGRLLETLRDRYPNTIFIVTADHGETFWERGGMGHGTSLYEEQIHVPLIIEGPGVQPGRVEETVSILGLMPTVTALLDMPQDAGWQGRDWLAPTGDDVLFSRTRGPWATLNVNQEAVVHGPWKLLVDHTRDTESLYRLDTDAGEARNLRSEAPEFLGKLRKCLEKHRAANLLARPEGLDREERLLDKTAVEKLNALGYVGGSSAKKKEPKSMHMPPEE